MIRSIRGLAILIIFLNINIVAKSQHAISIDAGYIKNFHNNLNGLDISTVFYFNKKWALAFEVNNFFSSKKMIKSEEVELSALDFDLNIHRYFSIAHHFKFYPILGISHTSEKEKNLSLNETHYIDFFSMNTGAGITFGVKKRWHPAIEFTYAWGRFNQQFLLINVAYEIAF
jgi:hypothetical protein